MAAIEWTTTRTMVGTGLEGQSAGVGTYPVVTADGNFFRNDGRKLIHMNNSHGANTYNVTIATPGTVDGYAVDEVVVAFAISEDYWIGPFDPRIFNNAQGYVNITYSGVAPATDLTYCLYTF